MIYKEINAKYDANQRLQTRTVTEDFGFKQIYRFNASSNLPTDVRKFEDGNTPPLSDKDISNIEDSINEEMESIAPQ